MIKPALVVMREVGFPGRIYPVSNSINRFNSIVKVVVAVTGIKNSKSMPSAIKIVQNSKNCLTRIARKHESRASL